MKITIMLSCEANDRKIMYEIRLQFTHLGEKSRGLFVGEMKKLNDIDMNLIINAAHTHHDFK